jgi:hypothetical protein
MVIRYGCCSRSRFVPAVSVPVARSQATLPAIETSVWSHTHEYVVGPRTVHHADHRLERNQVLDGAWAIAGLLFHFAGSGALRLFVSVQKATRQFTVPNIRNEAMPPSEQHVLPRVIEDNRHGSGRQPNLVVLKPLTRRQARCPQAPA